MVEWYLFNNINHNRTAALPGWDIPYHDVPSVRRVTGYPRDFFGLDLRQCSFVLCLNLVIKPFFLQCGVLRQTNITHLFYFSSLSRLNSRSLPITTLVHFESTCTHAYENSKREPSIMPNNIPLLKK